MTPIQARAFANSLLELADKAEAEGRDLNESDLDTFSAQADAAHDELAAVIAKRIGN